MEYYSISIYLVIASLIASLLVGLPFLFAQSKVDPEKTSAYECGFDPFDDARSRFDIKFYLVCILFIIFDLEISYLFPWALTYGNLPSLGIISMLLFLFILTIGFVYEWCKGALEWE